MPRGFLIKMRARMAHTGRKRPHLKRELSRLERMQDNLEMDIDKIRGEIDTLEGLEDLEAKRHHNLGWISGRLTVLALQDFVGAAFGALFFVVTQEVWELSFRLAPLNITAIFLLSVALTFLLVYLSRRRKMLSSRVYNTAFLRGLEIYTISLVTALVFVIIFGTAGSLGLIIKQSIVVALPATLSAATADLLFY